MNIFFEPVNVNQWNIFEKVKKIGHIEPFLATKQMNVGDLMLLHVGQQNNRYESGIYAIGKIIEGPFIMENHPDDYCNNKNTVNIKITSISYSEPYVTHEECKAFINQFRTVHKINETYYEDILKRFDNLGVSLEDTENIDELETELETLGLAGKERLAYIKVRVNQSVFREKLLQRYNNCCLCKVENTELLIASHIKPWSESYAKEKLDVENGLLLCPNHDALFDGGFISFDDDGKILISDRLTQMDKVVMNINPDMKIKLTEGNKVYMEYHRNNIFK